jgi:hypothetical protein
MKSRMSEGATTCGADAGGLTRRVDTLPETQKWPLVRGPVAGCIGPPFANERIRTRGT